MGVVIPFPRQIAASQCLEQALLKRLGDSFEVVWYDGSAIPGIPRGVGLVKSGQLLGIWRHGEHGFTYWPVGAEKPTIQARTVSGAYQLGQGLRSAPEDPRDSPSRESRTAAPVAELLPTAFTAFVAPPRPLESRPRLVRLRRTC
jgi:hypothetical protein